MLYYMYQQNRGDYTIMFDYSKPVDKNAPHILPSQFYHTKEFQGFGIGADMEKFFEHLYRKQGDFHIINLSTINQDRVLLVYATPFY